MANGIFVFTILLTCALSLITGASIALCFKEEKEAPVQEENVEMSRQWSEFLSYDGRE